MIKTITPAEMKRVENRVMANTSITGEALMQTAAAHVAQTVRRVRRARGGAVLCVCGTGNNGGDGMAAMRMLAQADEAFCGVCLVLPGKLSQDAVRELDSLQAEAGERVSVRILQENDKIELPQQLDCVIDAVFGTGLSRAPEGLAADLCKAVNACDAPVVAVDIPSGLNGESGEAFDAAVKADYTVTFHRPKNGLYLRQGPDHAGEIIIADIGLNAPEAAALDDADGMFILEKTDLKKLLPARKRTAHKGNYGRVLLFVGSRGMAGAAALSALAALRAGVGLVTVACPEKIVDIIQVLCPCATCLPLSEDVQAAWEMLTPALEKADAVGMGCGLGTSEWARELTLLAAEKLAKTSKPAVLDADALNLLSGEAPQKLGGQTFITPHPMEASRLLHQPIAAVLENAAEAALQLRETYGASVVLKGCCSLLCAREGLGINPYGTPAMAKGGSGDALTGIMAALLAGRAAGAYTMNDLELMQTASALHGIAGEMAAQQMGERGTLATDLCNCIGLVEGCEEETPSVQMHSTPQTATVIVEHPAGSRDAEDRRKVYRRNLGYVQEVLREKNEWQTACILGVADAVEWYEGQVCAMVRVNASEIWAIASSEANYTRDDIVREMSFLGKIETVEMTKDKLR